MAHMAATVTTTTLVCSKCGIIKKSGKTSCCGRGGSWFGNCGIAGDRKVYRTWFEGLRVCKARTQLKVGIGQHLNDVRKRRDGSATGSGNANYNAVHDTANMLVFTFDPLLSASPISLPVHTPVITFTDNIVSTTKGSSTTTSARVTKTRNSTNMLMTVLAGTPAASQGCEQLLDIAVHISLSLTVLIC